MTRDTNCLRRTPLAIVGMACRAPGADNLAEFWDMLVAGRSAVGDLSPEWFDQELYYDRAKGTRGKSYTRRGAIPASRRLDRDRCPVPPELARGAEPTHLVLCQTAADALRHADMDPMNVALRNTGVYVGHTIGSGRRGDLDCALAIEPAAEVLRQCDDFASLPAAKQEAIVAGLVERVRREFCRDAGDARDLASHMVAGIIAKSFGLAGPFMAVNAACASSLVALLLAGRALARGAIDMAIVGGASVCGLDWLVLFSAAQSVSPADSRPFDHRADGLVIAEAYAALVVKTLDRAVADGDPIHAVVRGMGVSSDGRGRSLWAPRREGQVEAIRRAYGLGVDMADLQYVEAHATATQLGDATEIAALAEALGGALPEGKKIPITSVKANMGHALEAAGLVGVIKTALCMRHGMIPPAVKIEKLNPNIDWAAAPVYVPLEPTPWPAGTDGRPRRGGVNAFGVGGLNVHVVLDEYQPSAAACCPPPAVGCLLPAASPKAAPPPAVAIIGLGCVLAGAHNAAQYWELLRTGATGVVPVPREQHEQDVRGTPTAAADGVQGGFVRGFEYDWRRHRIPPKQMERADPLQFMVLAAADEALADSGYDRREFDRRRTGVIAGTEFAGDFTLQLNLVLRLPHVGKLLGELLTGAGESPRRAAEIVAAFADAVCARWPVLADETGSFSASSLAGRLIKTWDLMGGGAALDSGATSAAAALGAAADLLISGDCDMVFCVGAQRDMAHAAADHVPGEGAAVLLLKRLDDARRDGDRIRAVVRAVEAVHGDTPEASCVSLRRALTRAGCGAQDVALVMTDAAAVGDDEAMVRAVLNSRDGREESAPRRDETLHVGSVVGQIGHTGGASAGASLVAAILAMEGRTSAGVVVSRGKGAAYSVVVERE